jgi:hypothetical protein
MNRPFTDGKMIPGIILECGPIHDEAATLLHVGYDLFAFW